MATSARALLDSFIQGKLHHFCVKKSNLSAVLRHSTFSPTPPYPPTAYILLSGPIATYNSSLLAAISGSLDHFPFFKSSTSNLFSTVPPWVFPPELPPQKYIFASDAQAANPDLAFCILKGRVLKELYFKLYSSISLVLYPSLYFPPNIKILDFEIATALNLVLAVYIGASVCHYMV